MLSLFGTNPSHELSNLKRNVIQQACLAGTYIPPASGDDDADLADIVGDGPIQWLPSAPANMRVMMICSGEGGCGNQKESTRVSHDGTKIVLESCGITVVNQSDGTKKRCLKTMKAPEDNTIPTTLRGKAMRHAKEVRYHFAFVVWYQPIS